jgi:kinesin family protein 11
VSTLDYAFRAKNIRNKPQVNPSVSKRALLREFTAEIEKLKAELLAARQRDGVYLTPENFDRLVGENESKTILNEEQRAKIALLEANLRNKVQELFSMTTSFNLAKKEVDALKASLRTTSGLLERTELVLQSTRRSLEEETALRRAHQRTEEQLTVLSQQWLTNMTKTLSEQAILHAKLELKDEMAQRNLRTWRDNQDCVASVTSTIQEKLGDFASIQQQLAEEISASIVRVVQQELAGVGERDAYLLQRDAHLKDCQARWQASSRHAASVMDKTLGQVGAAKRNLQSMTGGGLHGFSALAARITAEVSSELQKFQIQVSRPLSPSPLKRGFLSLRASVTDKGWSTSSTSHSARSEKTYNIPLKSSRLS